MSRQTRLRKQKLLKRKKLFYIIISIFIALFVFAGYYRSNQSLILEQEEYQNAVSGQMFFLRDCDYLEIEDFSSNSLNVPEGTKVSGYDILTNTELIISQDYLTSQLEALNTLLTDRVYENWDNYSLEMQDSLTYGGIMNTPSTDYYKKTARYFPEDSKNLEADMIQLSQLNTGIPTSLTLNQFGLMKTGYIYSSISEYDKIACEAALGSISMNMINVLNQLSLDKETALRVINNDHCYAFATVDINTPVQGEDEVIALKEQYKENLTNSDYFNMLITRVDRLRLYPEISFHYNNQDFPAYLVDVVEDSNKKILVIMIKEYLKELSTIDKMNTQVNVQDFRAWVVPQTAIIKKDDKNYLELLQKGYFTNEIEVNVNLYDKGKAILRVSDNPNLSDGLTIKMYP